MTDYTPDYLNELLERHPDGEIRTTALNLKTHMAELERETDPEKKATLAGAVRDLATVLEHELHANARGGEDYINDGVFHSRY